MTVRRATPDPESALLARLRQGDRAAFAEVFRDHRRIVYQMAYRILGSHDGADEATQIAFVKAWHAIGRFRGESSLRTWLVRIALNVAKTMRVSRGRSVDLAEAREPTAAVDSPDVTATLQESRRLVRGAVRRLPPRQQEVVNLKVFGDMSYTQVAEVMGLSPGSVKAHLHQAVSNLRKNLAAIEKKRGNR